MDKEVLQAANHRSPVLCDTVARTTRADMERAISKPPPVEEWIIEQAETLNRITREKRGTDMHRGDIILPRCIKAMTEEARLSPAKCSQKNALEANELNATAPKRIWVQEAMMIMNPKEK